MNDERTQIVQELFNQYKILSLENAEYKQWVFKYTFLELEKDLMEAGDITTKSLLEKDKLIHADIVAKTDGIIAGIAEIKYFIFESDKSFRPRLYNIEVKTNFKDGDPIKKGDTVLQLKGLATDILKSERVVLNLLQHMSGIATHTKNVIQKAHAVNPDVLVVPTRKTTWGWLDKKAVTIGGGGTHRLNLEDAILIKDNHLALFNNNIEEALSSLNIHKFKFRFIELEVDEPEKVIPALKFIKAHKDLSKLKPFVIMFDNMQPKIITGLIGDIKAEGLYDDFLFEASGGINEDNIGEYAGTGVDVLSMGALTQKITPIDLSLNIEME